MLNMRRNIAFISAFLFALLILLSVCLAAERILEMERITASWGTLKSSAGAAAYFLVMSGYGLVWPLVFFYVGKRMTSTARRLTSIVAFSACYIGFFVMFSDEISRFELVMFTAGIFCVWLADVVAEAAVFGWHRKTGIAP